MIPFEEALEPLARRCLERLRLQTPGGADVFTEHALSGLEADLVTQLSRVSGRVLYEDFAALRGADQGHAGSGRRVYEGYVSALLEGRWTTLLRDYPEMERLVDVVSAFWEESCAELLVRLAEDRSLIETTFGGEVPPGRVAELAPGLSDRHDRGRTVCAVTFESGLKVIYKPRHVGIDSSFRDLVAWLNERGLDPPLSAPRTLDRGSYGWAEFIPASGCSDESAAGRFYRRAGALACLMDVLGATDLHYGNLIACGEWPILVDLETLFHPVDVRRDAQHDRDDSSVLDTGLTPFWTPAPDARSYDVSGLGAVSPRATRVPSLQWSRANSDAMAFAPKMIPIPRLANVPTLDGRYLSPDEFTSEILNGFADAHRFLASHAADLLDGSGPLRAMADRETRVLLRHTLTYGRLIEATLSAPCLRDGFHRRSELQRLLAGAGPQGRPAATGLDEQRVGSEAEALLRLDIPRFTTRPDAVFLAAGGDLRIEGWSEEPPFDRVARRLGRLDDEDLDRNCRLLKTTLDLVGIERLMNPA